VLVCSWNVGQEKASYESLRAWLKFPTAEVGVVVVGLQEVEMGAGFLAMSAAKETVKNYKPKSLYFSLFITHRCC
jgi:hypothetical protein